MSRVKGGVIGEDGDVIRGCFSLDPCKGTECKELLLQRTITMTDKESKAYEKLAKEGTVFVGTNIFNDKEEKHVRYAQFYLYKKTKK